MDQNQNNEDEVRPRVLLVFEPKFEMGQIVATAGVAAECNSSQITHVLQRHANADWGDLCEEDKESNDLALINGSRLFSSYEFEDFKLWVITEWDRSVTTVLFPDEY